MLASPDIHVTVTEVWAAEDAYHEPGRGSSFRTAIHSLSFIAQAAEPHSSSRGHNMSGVSAVLTGLPATASVQLCDINRPYFSWEFKYLLD